MTKILGRFTTPKEYYEACASADTQKALDTLWSAINLQVRDYHKTVGNKSDSEIETIMNDLNFHLSVLALKAKSNEEQ